ncbi:MAG: phytoene desaturase family protein, partial [Rhodoferax sp.]
RKGYEWDVGVHYIGDVMRSDTPLRRVFDSISQGRLQWADMGPVVDRIDVGQGLVDFRAGKEAFREGLLQHFPHAAADLQRYLDCIRQGEKDMGRVFAPRLLPAPFDRLAEPLARLRGLGAFGRSTQDVMQQVTRDATLAGVLTGQWGDYGLPPSQSAFGVHAMIARHYLRGGAYPVGGASAIARSIVPTIEAAGGLVLVRAEVAEVLVEGNAAVGVRLADGSCVRCAQVVSGTGIDTTATRLLPMELAQRLFGQRHRTALSCGHIGLNLGFKHSSAALGLERPNLWLHASADHDGNSARFLADDSAPLPFVYASFPSAKDPNWDARHPGRSTVDLIAAAPYARFARWADMPWRKRGADYQRYKEALTQKMLAPLLRQLPHLRDKIDYMELSTPLSTRTFCNYGAGQLYGMDHTPERFAHHWLRPKTALKGFYLTGQDILTCGVGGALFAGVATFSSITGLGGLRTLRGVFNG